MTAVTDEAKTAGGVPADGVGEQLARQLVERARAQGLDLTGPDGLLRRVTKLVLEGALEGEITDHLGYGKHDPAGKDSGTPATASGPRPCSPTSARCAWMCPGIGTAASSRRSCVSGSAG